ncbi:MAG: cell division protein ZapD [Gammaproteobacteria bacterium]|nr:cell division protein ZapD [Gammaproteobacteria bacterium]
MIQALTNAPQRDQAEELVVYEQPLGERMRTFLRLDFLHRQALHHLEGSSGWSTRAAVQSLLDILAILNRGDVRGEVLKELERQSTALDAYQTRPGVDAARLNTLLANIGSLRDALNAAGPQFIQPLKESEFLSAIKHRSAIPGGTCVFDLPEYNHWLNRPTQERRRDFQVWMTLLRPLSEAVAELLWLTREGARPRAEVAFRGMFQLALAGSDASNLLRIALPATSDVYPEISGSHHRFTVRFMSWSDALERPVNSTADTRFLLSCC